MTCTDVDARIEELAAGDELPAAVAAHLSGCPHCAIRLANARTIERALRDLPAPSVPAHFAAGVMARVRRERWRSEQVVDWAFNIALGFGGLLIVSGLAGIAWTTGLISIGGDLMTVLSRSSPLLVERVVAESPSIVMAAILLTATLGLWWWAQNEHTI